MEDGLVREHELVNAKERGVLILVVVEDGLVRVEQKCQHCNDTWVLILVVVEDGLVLW